MVFNLTSEIRRCKKCKDIKIQGTLDIENKPFVNFCVEESWKPKQVKVLFIAESPPWQGYFYDKQTGNNRICLRSEMLHHLNLISLEEFKTKGYFLIDAIKCRLKKQKKEGVPNEVLVSCSNHFLQKEINKLQPEAIIFILGNSAKKALCRLPGFEMLKNCQVTNGYEAKLSKFHIILSVYPGKQTRMQYKKEIKESFNNLKKRHMQ